MIKQKQYNLIIDETLDVVRHLKISSDDIKALLASGVFEIDKDDVYSRKDTILGAMQDIWWHQATDQWDHTRAYYEGDGSETLNL